jgi:hypothetical protein
MYIVLWRTQQMIVHRSTGNVTGVSLSSIKKILREAKSTETGENSDLGTPTKEHVSS